MCKHTSTKSIRTRCFTGPVARDENPRAHGCVTITEECTDCGAIRDCNVNQCYEELGSWGPSRAERQLAADAARRAIPVAPAPLYSRERPIAAESDEDGLLHIFSTNHTPLTKELESEALASLPRDFLAACKSRREAILNWQELQAEV